MSVKIQFSTDNAAFDPPFAHTEAARILRELADRLDNEPDPQPRYVLRDANGNTVGAAEVQMYDEAEG